MTKTKITLCGKEYSVVSEDAKEYVHRVAMHLEDTIQALSECYPNLSNALLMTLAALNVTDDLLKMKEQMELLRDEVEGLRETVRDMKIRSQVGSAGTAEELLREQVRNLTVENEMLKNRRDVSGLK